MVPAIGLLAGLGTAAQAQPADTILINGKIVTVDDRFTIASRRIRAAESPRQRCAIRKRKDAQTRPSISIGAP